MKITLTIETSSDHNTNLSFAKDGEPATDSERIMFDVILESLNQAISVMAEASKGVSVLRSDAKQIGTRN